MPAHTLILIYYILFHCHNPGMADLFYFAEDESKWGKSRRLYIRVSGDAYRVAQGLLAEVRQINATCKPFDKEVEDARYAYGVEMKCPWPAGADVLSVDVDYRNLLFKRYMVVNIIYCVSDEAAVRLVEYITNINTPRPSDHVPVAMDVHLFPPVTAQVLRFNGQEFQALVHKYGGNLSDVIIEDTGGVRGDQHVIVSKPFHEHLMRGRMADFKNDFCALVESARGRVNWPLAITW